MKISFMTWVCPTWTLKEVLAGAVRYDWDGVEPRAQAGHKHGVEVAATRKQRAQIRAAFEDCGVEMSCIATSIRYSSADPKERAGMVEQTRKFVDLAADLGCPHLRVFGGPMPEGAPRDDVKAYVAEALRQCGEYAAGKGVYVCLETHDDFRKAQDAADTVRTAAQPNVQICWDVAHPFNAGDTMQEAFDLVKPYVRHLHVHDMKTVNGKHEMAPIGEGEIPHDEVVQLLKGIAFAGHLSGEWIDAFAPERILPVDSATLRRYIREA
jgi:sugar phosphate isomerase/epimerase